jgi:hypothetical protein
MTMSPLRRFSLQMFFLRSATLAVLLLGAALAGCDNGGGSGGGSGGDVSASAPDAKYAAPPPAPEAASGAGMSAPVDRTALGEKRIAETHSVQIQVAPPELAARFKRDLDQCLAMGCELLNSSVVSESYASISARLDPDKLTAYLDFLAKGPGEVKQHGVSSEDKTFEYIDTEAALKNLTLLRERLSALLNTPNAKLEELLNVEREIARVQQEIDSATGRLRYLQNITQRATLNLTYEAYYQPLDTNYHALGQSFGAAWRGFIANLAMAIETSGNLLPWLFLLGIAGAILFAFWRRRKKQHSLTHRKDSDPPMA